MKKLHSLDPLELAHQTLKFFFMFIDSDLDNPKYYLDLMLDIKNSRTNGYPLRFTTENELVYQVIKDEMLTKIHFPLIKLLNSSGADSFDKTSKLAFKVMMEKMFKTIESR